MFNYFSKKLVLVRDYLKNPNKYIKEQIVTINGKKRILYAYQPNKDGDKLRELHKSIVLKLEPLYVSSDCSFAYKKGLNIVDCISKHLDSNAFMKCDIKNFFGSISYENFIKHLNKIVNLDKKSSLDELLKTCFYQGKLPLGFCSSPLISDIYMTEIDKLFATKKNIIYTRYADDFIISTKLNDTEKLFKGIKSQLWDELEKLDLDLNNKKTRICKQLAIGGHFHSLGLNIVRSENNKNKITISDKYLRETCKDLANYLQLENKTYSKWAEVNGKINFISSSSIDSYNKFEKLVLIKINKNLNDILKTEKQRKTKK